MEINGENISEEEVQEMLKAIEEHLIDQFGVTDQEVAFLAFDDAKKMFESRENYPDKYWRLVERLRAKSFQALAKEPVS
jgi:predicted RND superfamily exporter protein